MCWGWEKTRQAGLYWHINTQFPNENLRLQCLPSLCLDQIPPSFKMLHCLSSYLRYSRKCWRNWKFSALKWIWTRHEINSLVLCFVFAPLDVGQIRHATVTNVSRIYIIYIYIYIYMCSPWIRWCCFMTRGFFRKQQVGRKMTKEKMKRKSGTIYGRDNIWYEKKWLMKGWKGMAWDILGHMGT